MREEYTFKNKIVENDREQHLTSKKYMGCLQLTASHSRVPFAFYTESHVVLTNLASVSDRFEIDNYLLIFRFMY